MVNKKRSKVETISKALRDLCNDYIKTNRLILPSLRSLQIQLNVSRPTLIKAINELQSKGILFSVKRKGVFIQAKPDLKVARECLQIKKHETRAEEIAEAIKRDIVNGVYPFGSMLPLVKELCVRYGSCYRTMSDALVTLEKSEKVQKKLRRHFITSNTIPSATGTIIVFTDSNDMRVLKDITPRAYELWRSLEIECKERNVRLEIMSSKEIRSAKDIELKLKDVESTGLLVGSIFWIFQLPHQVIVTLIETVPKYGKGIAILDETPESLVKMHLPSCGSFKVFSLGTGTDPGRIVGDYLIEKRYRYIAYFTADPNDITSQDRYRGLHQAFMNVERSIVKLFSPVNPPLPDLERYILNDLDYLTSIEKVLKALRGKNQNAFSIDSIQNFILFNRRKSIIEGLMSPLFENALDDIEINAWILYNDELALCAREFLLKSKNKRKIAIIGFDDRVESVGVGLTSYNFNVRGVIRAILNYLITFEKKKSENEEITNVFIPGFVIERR